MATARLVASSYSTSNSSYATVYSGESNLYENTSNTSYASLRGWNRNSTTAYYIFVKGFNFDSIPSNATVNSFSVKVCSQTQPFSSAERIAKDFEGKIAEGDKTKLEEQKKALDRIKKASSKGTKTSELRIKVLLFDYFANE